MGYNVAVLGATGLVGQEFLKVLEQRRFPIDSLKLLASARSAGKKLVVLGTEHVVEEAKSGCFEGIDIAFFSAGGEASRHFTPIAIC
ncbi:aspartate-semialdehyde dehydrogenase, partial [Chloroflexota bacterium]